MKYIQQRIFTWGAMNSKKTRRRILLLASALLLIVIAFFAFDSRLLIRRYTIEADEINVSIRIALVTDLHSCKYGELQSELIEAVEEQNPDMLLLGGDIFDDVLEDTNTELFLAGIADKYPCYYVTGNHEYWSGRDNFAVKMAVLEKYNIPVLSGATVTLEVNGQTVNLCGVDDPDMYMVETNITQDSSGYVQAETNKASFFAAQLERVSTASQNGHYTILLSHRPEYYETYISYDFDLVLCGHAHGGQWRIPLLLNGLYAPHQGLFPKYAGGLYEANGMTMIVSRGLARETTGVPRIFNRPELVIIELR